jgi:predicted nucleotidyltransferase
MTNAAATSQDTTTPPSAVRRRLLHARVRVDTERLAELCRRYGVRRLAFFGSVLRYDFTPESDLDVLVEYLPGVKTGLAFIGLENDLSELFGRKVDLNTPNSLHRRFRDEVLAEAENVYVAA